MEGLDAFLKALPIVASSPFAFVCYLGLLCLWGFHLFQRWHTKLFLKSLDGLSSDEKMAVIKRKSPDFAPRSGFSAKQYLQYASIRSLTWAFFVSAIVAVIIVTNSTYRAHVQGGIETLRIQNDVLRESLRRALRLTRLGIQESDQKRYESAAVFLQEAAQENPSYETWMNLGYVLEDISEVGRAKDAYMRASELAPSEPRPLSNLGMLWLYDDPVKARDWLTKALDLYEQQGIDDKELLLMINGNIGNAYYDLANSSNGAASEETWRLFALARKHYEQAIDLIAATRNEDFVARMYSNMGNVCVAFQDSGLAKTYFDRALAIKRRLAASPSLATTENNYGELLLSLGNREEAKSLFERARDVFSLTGHRANEALVLYNLAEVAEREGHREESCRLLTRAKDLCLQSGSTTYLGKIEAKLNSLRCE